MKKFLTLALCLLIPFTSYADIYVIGGGSSATVDEASVRDALADSTGTIDLNGQTITDVGNVDGVDVSALATTVTGLGSHAIADIGDDGSTQTQRARLNLISGNSGTVTCADNAGSSSYDCTIAVTTTPATQTAVGATRSISTTAPITGGGDLSANRTLAMAAATASVDGYMTAAQAAINAALGGVSQAQVATVNTTNASNTAIGAAFSLPTSGGNYIIDVDLVGRLTSSDGSSVTYKRRLIFSNDAGTVTSRHTLSATGYDGESATPTLLTAANGLVAPTISTTNVTMNVQGIAATNMTWTMFATLRTFL